MVSVFLYFFGTRAELGSLCSGQILFYSSCALGSNSVTHILDFGSIFERFLISPAQHQIHHSTPSVIGIRIWSSVGDMGLVGRQLNTCAETRLFGLCHRL